MYIAILLYSSKKESFLKRWIDRHAWKKKQKQKKQGRLTGKEHNDYSSTNKMVTSEIKNKQVNYFSLCMLYI